MHRVIIPDNLHHSITAFFTGKDPGADTAAVAAMFGLPQARVYLPIQKHTDKVLVLEASLEPKIADAVITRERGILIGVQVADCVPILLYDGTQKVVAAVHAGWRGTAESILGKTIEAMHRRFASEPGKVMAAIGPSIRRCCYEVGADVFRAVTSATGKGQYHHKKGEKHCIDLASANHHQALRFGIREQNIWISDACTFCNPEMFFSYRYARGSTGRQAAFIGII